MKILHKALGISLLIHLAVVVSLIALPAFLAKKRYTPVYQVSLVTQPEPQPKKPTVQAPEKKPPVKKPTKKEKKAAPPKKKPKKTVKKKETKQKEYSMRNVQKAIDDIKRKMATQQETEAERSRTAKIIEARRNLYFDTIAAHIQANWSLLKNQMEDVGILTTDIGLRIRRDGTITRIVIEKPSGNALFDEYAVRAVKRSTPLPPFPSVLKEDRLDITIGLSS
ncbi:MAG: TonB family protein [Proteobacteria bacterium]|nr:TonB family protein [Pseudomonadota bacterium]